jgi:hypothetical protein
MRKSALTNPALGGFLIDLHTLVQESKLCLFESSIAEGGDNYQGSNRFL